VTESDVFVDVDFLARTLDFRTTGTTLTNIETGGGWTEVDPEPSLDIVTPQPLLSYDPGINRFTGNVIANGVSALTGQATGQFYGPAAEELGGVFSLTGSDGQEHYSGAYGAAVVVPVP
jgi:hypothetical protein